ncbi:MAG: hypothetical protein ACFE8L_06870 [Candidatus Hodarchaeota archaeon]
MSKKLYVCSECGYVFPEQLSHLIEQNIQVYCERCGSPFILEGVEFKPAPVPYRKKILPSPLSISQKDSTALNKIIQILNKIAFIPLFLFTIINFGLIFGIIFDPDNWFDILFKNTLQGVIGLFILIYDRAYISPNIKERKFNVIFIDALCWGILGCVVYGTGVIILIKGILIMIYVITDKKNQDLKAYDFGLLIKNSLNYFSAKAGFLIILLGILGIYLGELYLPRDASRAIIIEYPVYIELSPMLLALIVLLIIALIAIISDSKSKHKIKEKREFKTQEAIPVIICGIFGTIFFAAGIFILLKGVLLFVLSFGKPSEIIPKEEIQVSYIPPYKQIEPPDRAIPEEKIVEIEEPSKPIISQPPPAIPPEDEATKIEQQKEVKYELGRIEKEDKKKYKKEKEEKEKEFELKLHESLLPVKNEKDKKLVKQYFSKIFTVLSKDLRQQIIDLKIPNKEKKELLEELVFLTKEEQIKYIEALVNLYQEIPHKLILRIRRLPNVKPKHYDKIVDQLKYMNADEQIRFIKFLEENA